MTTDAKEEMKMEWVKCSDKRPEMHQEVFGWDGKARWHLKYYGMGTFVTVPGNWNKRITHWMPLPLPPKDGE